MVDLVEGASRRRATTDNRWATTESNRGYGSALLGVAFALFVVLLTAAFPGGAETTEDSAPAASAEQGEGNEGEGNENQTEVTEPTATDDSEAPPAETSPSTAPAAPAASDQGSTPQAETNNDSEPTTSPPASESQAEVEAREQSKQQELSMATARLDELNGTLATAQSRVRAQEAELEIALNEFEDANRILEESDLQATRLEQTVEQLERNLHEQAIRSFMGESNDVPTLLGQNPAKDLRMKSMLSKATESDLDYAALLTAAKDNLTGQRRQAEIAAGVAREAAQASEGRLRELEEVRSSQQRLAIRADERIDYLLAEQQALEQIGQQAAAGLNVNIDAELKRRLDAIAPPTAPSSTRSADRPGTVSRVDIVEADKGIMVHREIVADVRQLLADAAADGVVLAGGGYRDPQRQIEVRRANCGTSEYAIYEMPSRNCSPPTARPGRSMHEQGKAIDFTYGGSIIRSRSGPAWNWLKANASKYGLYNLPSEPWHWSVNGR